MDPSIEQPHPYMSSVDGKQYNVFLNDWAIYTPKQRHAINNEMKRIARAKRSTRDEDENRSWFAAF